MQKQEIRGGEFLLPDHGVYFPIMDNMLWWFANAEYHGTAILKYEPSEGFGRITMAHSIPRALWRALKVRSLTRSRPEPRPEGEASRSEGAARRREDAAAGLVDDLDRVDISEEV